jgi:hypothetical protein
VTTERESTDQEVGGSNPLVSDTSERTASPSGTTAS